VGVQSIVYTQSNGGGKNYDRLGHNAAENNRLFVYAWTAL